MKAKNAVVVGTLATLSLAALSGAAFASPPAGTWSANPTFVDDFNGTTLDSTKWSKGMRWADVINNELQGYVPENVTVANGYCTIKAEKRTVQNTDWVGYKGATKSYASGAIQTWNKWTQAYGYFEARIKMSSGKGTWPAFWLLPDRGSSTTPLDKRTAVGGSYGGSPISMGNEIDILEIMATWKNPTTGIGKSHSGFFWNYNGGSWGNYALMNNGNGPAQFPLANPDTEFHTYGLAWGPGKLDFYIDDIKVLSREEPLETTKVGTAPHYMILNAAMHTDDWTGTPVPLADIDATAPSNMVIDYVKVWSGQPTPNPAPVAEGVYRITPKSDATKAVQVAGAGTADSDNVNLGTYTGATNQQWNLQYLGGNVYEMTAQHSGKVLDVAGGNWADNTNVDQYTDNNSTGQRWKLQMAGSGYYRVIPMVNGNSGLSSWGTTEGTNVYSTYYSGNNGQLWKFEPVSGPPTNAVVIVDNASGTGITTTGVWTASTYATGQFYGNNYWHDNNTGKGTKTITFTPNLPVTATYKVYAMWNGNSPDRASSVPFTITYAGGSATVNKDQRTNGGQWVLLGTYAFNSGTGGNVTISTTGTDNYVIADAVRFEQQ